MVLHLATFSIVGHCPRSSMLGVAVSTAVPAVGALCPHVKAGVGAVSTQSWVNPYLAIDALQLMERGAPGPEALEQVLAADDGANLRQIGVVDAQGHSASWSGDGCTSWYGHITEENFAVQGNMLVGEATLTAMAEAFRDSASLDLAERLLLALEAGNSAGGDKLQLLPFVAGMPKRGQPAGSLSESVTEMLLAPPPDRPGGGGSAP